MKKSSSRIDQLSKPRTSDIFRNDSSVILPINQELIRPIPKHVLTYKPTKRICELAAPRKPLSADARFDLELNQQRRQVCFERLDELAQPAARYINPHDDTGEYQKLGQVTPAALLYEITERVNDLAEPRNRRRHKPEPWLNESRLLRHHRCRSRSSSKRYNPAHDQLLARPRTYYEPPFDYDEWARRRVQAACHYQTRERDIILSIPKNQANLMAPHFHDDLFVSSAIERSEYACPHRNRQIMP